MVNTGQVALTQDSEPQADFTQLIQDLKRIEALPLQNISA